jgi:ribosome biogenesis GTPase
LETLEGLTRGRVVALAGLSGVGKSTLINRLVPGLCSRTGELSTSHDAGRHTTTFAEMFPAPGGGFVVDTPGIRAFGLVGVEREELARFFPEMFRVAPACRYYNCTHVHEPGCAVMAAVEDGRISESRYASYTSMFFEGKEKYR